MTRGAESLAGRIAETFKGRDPQTLVAGADPLQAQAGQAAAGLGGFPGYGGGSQPYSGPSGVRRQGNDMAIGGPVTDALGPGYGGDARGLKDARRSDGGGTFAGTSPMQPGDPSSGNPFGDAMNTLRDVSETGGSSVQAGDIAGGMQSFMSPYLKDVVDTSLADYDYGAGQQTAQTNLDVAGDDTFGGSGGSIQKALLGGNLARGRGTLSAGLRDQGWGRAGDLSTRQAEMRQQASVANAGFAEQALARRGGAATDLAGVAGAQGGDTRANIGMQGDMGDILRQIAQARASAPITALGAESDLNRSLSPELFRGSNATGSLNGTQTTTESGASMGDILKLAGGAAMAFGTGGEGAGLGAKLSAKFGGGKLLGGLGSKFAAKGLGAGIYKGGR